MRVGRVGERGEVRRYRLLIWRSRERERDRERENKRIIISGVNKDIGIETMIG